MEKGLHSAMLIQVTGACGRTRLESLKGQHMQPAGKEDLKENSTKLTGMKRFVCCSPEGKEVFPRSKFMLSKDSPCSLLVDLSNY